MDPNTVQFLKNNLEKQKVKLMDIFSNTDKEFWFLRKTLNSFCAQIDYFITVIFSDLSIKNIITYLTQIIRNSLFPRAYSQLEVEYKYTTPDLVKVFDLLEQDMYNFIGQICNHRLWFPMINEFCDCQPQINSLLLLHVLE